MYLPYHVSVFRKGDYYAKERRERSKRGCQDRRKSGHDQESENYEGKRRESRSESSP